LYTPLTPFKKVTTINFIKLQNFRQEVLAIPKNGLGFISLQCFDHKNVSNVGV
jgi:hypothetical protein